MKNKEWITHLINRFGIKDTLKFAEDSFRCPCSVLNKYCTTCTFLLKERVGMLNWFIFGCEESSEWHKLPYRRVKKIKKKIRKGSY
jgi:hypothetical protein